jgi:hypothetical protein
MIGKVYIFRSYVAIAPSPLFLVPLKGSFIFLNPSAMKVLLLGCTGNLGLRCIPALLAYNHTVTLYVRNTAKLRSLVSPAVLEKVAAIVVGDATNSADIKKAIKEHDIEGVVNVAGNQVPPWQEFLLPKIAKAVSDAAVAVGKERGASLRGWLVSGMNILLYPGAPNSYLIQD